MLHISSKIQIKCQLALNYNNPNIKPSKNNVADIQQKNSFSTENAEQKNDGVKVYKTIKLKFSAAFIY